MIDFNSIIHNVSSKMISKKDYKAIETFEIELDFVSFKDLITISLRVFSVFLARFFFDLQPTNRLNANTPIKKYFNFINYTICSKFFFFKYTFIPSIPCKPPV